MSDNAAAKLVALRGVGPAKVATGAAVLAESAKPKLVCPRAMVERPDGSLVVAEQDSMRLQVCISSSIYSFTGISD